MDKKVKKKYNAVEDTPVWQLSHELTLNVYKLSEKFPKTETYGLTSQVRRSASSVPANITEGFYRNSTKELVQFLYNARGSYGETLYHLRLAKDLGFINEVVYKDIIENYNLLGKQLNGWIKSLRVKINHQP